MPDSRFIDLDSRTHGVYCHYVTQFRAVKNELERYLKKNGIPYEVTVGCAGWSFNVQATSEEESALNLLMYNATKGLS